MSIFPAHKLFTIIPLVTFDYTFQYSLGQPGTAAAVNLDGYTAQWVVNWTLPTPGTHTYTSATNPGGSYTSSGVYFGGPTSDLTTGIIDLVLIPSDIAALPWTKATHQLNIFPLVGNSYSLLAGAIVLQGYGS